MNRSRLSIVIVLLVAFIASAALRQFAAGKRGEHDPTGGAGVPLSRMNSYALALLLGGLRGPLVMVLWPSSEGQKSEKNIEDLDTKIEWIRLLQAEFDTVHIFQIWNKAYNISVLMANLPNKYATILDAVDYAKSVDAERPGNVNILYAIGDIYFAKLGASAEKEYYRQRVRDETQARRPLMRVTFPAARKPEFLAAATEAGAIPRRLQFVPDARNNTLAITIPKSLADTIQPRFAGADITWVERERVKRDRSDPGWRRVELDPVLDPAGNILPELLQPRASARVTPNGNDGSELQYLRKYQPFAYGVSTYALAYNYHKQVQQLFRANQQHHAQLSDLVLDSRPSLALRDWSEEEWQRGRMAELDALGIPVPNYLDRHELDTPAARIPLDTTIVNRPALDEAIFSYDRGARVAEDALVEYDLHLEKFQNNFATYQSHIDALRAEIQLLRGDRDFLKLLSAAPGEQRTALAQSAGEHYRAAARAYIVHLLKYYVTPPQVESYFPRGQDQSTIEEFARLHPDQAEQIVERIRDDVAKDGERAEHIDAFREYIHYLRRAQARLQTLQRLVPGTARAAR